jgi:hypothetical protein
MMGDRGITWACSSCGASFSTREALTAHVAANHGRHPSTSAARHDLVEPSVPAVPSEASAREPRQPDADLARQSEPAAAAVAAGEKPTAPPALQPLRRVPTSAHRTLVWVATAVICVAAAAALGIAFPHQIAHQIALSVTRQPTPYTELYFSDPQSLPSSLSLSAPNLFGFTVVNHEGHDTVYSYVVTLASSYGSSIIAQGRIDLKNNMSATRPVNVRPTHSATEYVTTVSLQGRFETIHFRGVSQ